MAAYVAGDRRAFTDLFNRLAPRVHGFFLRSFPGAVADDLLQTTFLKVHRARRDFREGSRLRPWLFAIAARVRLDELRRRYRLPEAAGEEELARVEDQRPDPAVALEEASDVRDRVRRAVDQLPESQRAIVHLHRFEGLTFPEIAQALSTTEGAVKLRAFRAYEKLRALLADLSPEGAA
jgi:RNA polymerase sigma-70 factor (ECF subfamily)